MKRSIKALLVEAGIKQVDLARQLGVDPSAVSVILSGRKRSRRIRLAIARALRYDVRDLWPDEEEDSIRGRL
jgi:transcriptional regulator with XRE-family HTH domain